MTSLVSVIITTYYRNDVLRDCISSVDQQSYHNIEIIVVDGSGVSYARDLIKEYDFVDYVSMEQDNGPHAARSVGFSVASGKYIQFLDDDDMLKKDKIKKQVELLEHNPRIGVVYCGQETPKGKNFKSPIPSFSGDVIEEALATKSSSCQTSTMLIRSSILSDIVPFRHWFNRDDVTLIIELAKRTRFDYITESAVIRRQRDDSLSMKDFDSVGNAHEIIDEYSSLYKEYPESRDSFLSRAYKNQARMYIDKKFYSFQAIRWYILGLYYSNGIKKRDIAEFFAILFGRLGYKFSLAVYKITR